MIVPILHVLILATLWAGGAIAVNHLAYSRPDVSDFVVNVAALWTVTAGFAQLGFLVPMGAVALLSGRRALAAGVGVGGILAFIIYALLVVCLGLPSLVVGYLALMFFFIGIVDD